LIRCRRARAADTRIRHHRSQEEHLLQPRYCRGLVTLPRGRPLQSVMSQLGAQDGHLLQARLRHGLALSPRSSYWQAVASQLDWLPAEIAVGESLLKMIQFTRAGLERGTKKILVAEFKSLANHPTPRATSPRSAFKRSKAPSLLCSECSVAKRTGDASCVSRLTTELPIAEIHV